MNENIKLGAARPQDDLKKAQILAQQEGKTQGKARGCPRREVITGSGLGGGIACT
jgi:hypothetical protein